MQWVSSVSQQEDTESALVEVVDELERGLNGAEPTVLLVFASADHMAAYADLPRDLLAAVPAGALAGCSGGGVIGGTLELEHRPALAVLAGVMPDVTATARRIRASDIPKSDDFERWHKLLGVTPDDDPQFVVLADPFSTQERNWLDGFDRAFPAATIVGGLISGSNIAEGLALFTNDDAEQQGVTVLSMHGNVRLDPVIAQGCKPIGEPMLVTSCEGNRIFGLGERKPAEVLRELYHQLPPDDQELFKTSLFVGLQMRDQVEYATGDFLIRNIMGIGENDEALAVGAALERWQVLQFHVRDQLASKTDLGRRLDEYVEAPPSTAPAGALLFSCLGRGEYLYRRPNHDSDLFRDKLGNVALAGFFCNGEIGPVGGKTFTHAYTSAFGLFRPRV